MPRPSASTAEVNANETYVTLAEVLVVVFPTKTERAFKFALPVSIPAAVAFRVISEITDWNSASSVDREPALCANMGETLA